MKIVSKILSERSNLPRIPVRFATGGGAPSIQESVRERVDASGIHTVCEKAACPNLHHCWSSGTATFLIMGERCTRRCAFCNIRTARPLPLNPEEPRRLAGTVQAMGLKHVVITSVDRDDLQDCGSTHFAEAIQMIRQRTPQVKIEVLIPDFKGRVDNLQKIWDAKPDIVNHNVETVPSLYSTICPQADYAKSLHVLGLFAERGFMTKSGLILGLGEGLDEVRSVMIDLRRIGVRMLTIGQYLRPGPQYAPVREWIPASVFEDLKNFGLEIGFNHVESGSLVRSSYHAADGMKKMLE